MSLGRSRIHLYRSLHHAPGRRETGLFLLEGPHLLREALQENWRLKEVLFTHEFRENQPEGRTLPLILQQRQIPFDFCSESDLSRIADAKTPQGVTALAKLPDLPESLPSPSDDELLLLGECISDPGNLGAVLRIADWFGLRRVILGADSADPFAPKVVRSSAGAIFRVNIVSNVNLTEIVRQESAAGRFLAAATVAGTTLSTHLPVKGRRGLVIGHEIRGVAPEIANLCSTTVRIPGRGRTESLNLAVAAGILLYELTSSGKM
ncbi:MAG: RNA methyltransferase [bacterium]